MTQFTPPITIVFLFRCCTVAVIFAPRSLTSVRALLGIRSLQRNNIMRAISSSRCYRPGDWSFDNQLCRANQFVANVQVVSQINCITNQFYFKQVMSQTSCAGIVLYTFQITRSPCSWIRLYGPCRFRGSDRDYLHIRQYLFENQEPKVHN